MSIYPTKEAMDIYFEFRLAFIDRPDVRLHTQEGRRPELVQVVLSEWTWDPPLPEDGRDHSWLDPADPRWREGAVLPRPIDYFSSVPPEDLTTFHRPVQWTGACEITGRCGAARSAARSFREVYGIRRELDPILQTLS